MTPCQAATRMVAALPTLVESVIARHAGGLVLQEVGELDAARRHAT
jgi:hypothetical protein